MYTSNKEWSSVRFPPLRMLALVTKLTREVNDILEDIDVLDEGEMGQTMGYMAKARNAAVHVRSNAEITQARGSQDSAYTVS